MNYFFEDELLLAFKVETKNNEETLRVTFLFSLQSNKNFRLAGSKIAKKLDDCAFFKDDL